MAGGERIVHLGGALVPLSEARISPEDRGFVFGDGVYEAVALYDGRPFRWDEHVSRLAAGLAALRIEGVDVGALPDVVAELQEANGLGGEDALLYLQVTRGAAPRAHAFPEPPVPATVYADLRPLPRRSPREVAEGVVAITVPDTRWTRCDVKTICLVANVLALEEAREAGGWEALLVRDRAVVEGSHSNLFCVRGGALRTHPEGPEILSGVTRGLVLELAAAAGVPLRLGPTSPESLRGAAEVFLTGTTTEVLPVVRVDGERIGDGRPGPVTRLLRRAWDETVARHRQGGGAAFGGLC